MSSEQALSNDPQVILSARGLGKLYTLYARPQDRLKQSIFKRFGKGSYGHSFWALRGVSFDLHRGETFAVIGRNGSGKSTLLQILAGILTPSEGRIEAHGRVAALLELGSGFNPEFTGRENVLFYGSILDIPRAEMLQRLEEIIAFADIGEFIDQPVKTYSSGMFVRLAFSVAVGVQADILLIDEALAVGDIFFRQKCYRRLEELRAKGVAIVLVSHAMNEVEQFCEQALLLHEGQVAFAGSAVEAVKRYYLIEQAGSSALTPEFERQPELPKPGQAGEAMPWPKPSEFLDLANTPQANLDWVRCTAFAVCDQSGQGCAAFQQGDVASFYYEFEIMQDIEVPTGGVEILNDKGTIVHGKNTLLYGTQAPSIVPGGCRVRFRQDIKLDLSFGEYSANVGMSMLHGKDYDLKGSLPHAVLDARTSVLAILPGVASFSILPRRSYEPVQLTHFGVANLPGNAWIDVVFPGNKP